MVLRRYQERYQRIIPKSHQLSPVVISSSSLTVGELQNNMESSIRNFCQRLPKSELHAHLNGSISLKTLEKLIELKKSNQNTDNECISPKAYALIQKGKHRTIDEVFLMFPLIQALTDTPNALEMATVDVIHEFCEDNVKYLELRSTPRYSKHFMDKSTYVDAILAAIKKCSHLPIVCRVLLSIDRRQTVEQAMDTVELAVKYAAEPEALVVGIDLSGDPRFDARKFIPVLTKAKEAGLKLTFHLAEIESSLDEVPEMLSLPPDRIGHGTYLDPESGGSQYLVDAVLSRNIPIEICLTSNVKCATVKSYDNHHMRFWLSKGLPVVISTDDKGLFDTDLSEEYYLAAETFDLDKKTLFDLSLKTLDCLFCSETQTKELKRVWREFYKTELE